ncbi:MAG TPA: KEOPS complex subunit Pcc1 [Candidatus Thermoplasmatota archaeon]|nr:KEOPS complex subunit Pcc1 [Candidatus Thermoplasmatota archaeon]
MTTHRAEYRIPCDAADQAERIRRALSVEQDGTPARTTVRVTTDGATLVLTMVSTDARGLRAATNSFLRWANTALEVDRLAGGKLDTAKA